MTTALGIAAVTATLRSLLSEGLVEHNLSGVLGSTATVSVLPPDRVVPQNGTEASQLNLFLHRVSANTGWRNEGLPSRDASGRNRLSNAPLALDLHYLLSAYSGGDLHAEILLGYAMQWLHESPLLTRGMIRQALTPAPLPGTPLERALFDSGLADQVELIKITPEHLDTEEMSKLWTATQSHLRPTAAYRATVVLIEASEPVRSALPVLTRGGVDPDSGRERGVSVEPGLEPAIPTLEALSPPGGQIVARLGETIDLTGHHLDGTGRTVLLGNDRFESELSLPALAAGGAALVQFSLPVADAAIYPVGVYRVGMSVQRPGESATSSAPMSMEKGCEARTSRPMASRPSAKPAARVCAPCASLISKRAMSSSFKPLRSSSSRIAGAGPMPMISGGTPTAAAATTRAKGFLPCALA